MVLGRQTDFLLAKTKSKAIFGKLYGQTPKGTVSFVFFSKKMVLV